MRKPNRKFTQLNKKLESLQKQYQDEGYYFYGIALEEDTEKNRMNTFGSSFLSMFALYLVKKDVEQIISSLNE